MPESAQPDRLPSPGIRDAMGGTEQSFSADAISTGAIGNPSNGSSALGETELDSALQLLVERAQYITGATGTALALPQGEEMVCRASAGSSAPAVGARLQVRSGLTGESIARRQLLRCDNAETDPRVNLETCRALGIASIVVLPLMRRNGEVRGLFELFSDHPYAFEERDLIALERMADLTLTALDLAEQRQNFAPAPRSEPEKPVESPTPGSARLDSAIALHAVLHPVSPEVAEPAVLPSESAAPVPAAPLPSEAEVISSSSVTTPSVTAAAPTLIPEAMRRVQKCASCGFPVSEGRTLCLDCEKKDNEKKDLEKKRREQEQHQAEQQQVESQETKQLEPEQAASPGAAEVSTAEAQEEFLPAFLANAVPLQESWLANHVNLLAVIVLILGILVAIVVFR